MKSYIYLKAIIIIISNLLNGQINTEEMRFESLNDGIHNSVGMNLGFEQANVQQFDASSNYRMDYIKNNNHFFITSNYSNSYSRACFCTDDWCDKWLREQTDWVCKDPMKIKDGYQ